MKRSALPPSAKIPFWAEPAFRLYLVVGVMVAAIALVVAVGNHPTFWRLAPEVERKVTSGPHAYVPRDPTRPPTVMFDGILDKAHDGSSIDDQDGSYLTLVRHVAGTDAATLERQYKDVDYDLFEKVPGELRGQTVRVLALFLKTDPIRLDDPSGGVEYVFRTYIADFTGREGYVVDLVAKPPPLARRALVAVDAVFLKIASYEGRSGTVRAPLLVGRELRAVNERSTSASQVDAGTMITAVWVMVGLCVALLVLQTVRGARSVRYSGPPSPPGPEPPAAPDPVKEADHGAPPP